MPDYSTDEGRLEAAKDLWKRYTSNHHRTQQTYTQHVAGIQVALREAFEAGRQYVDTVPPGPLIERPGGPIETKGTRPPCFHAQGTEAFSDHVVCNNCGAMRTDSGKEWGVARMTWFANRAEAEFYRDHGYLPGRGVPTYVEGSVTSPDSTKRTAQEVIGAVRKAADKIREDGVSLSVFLKCACGKQHNYGPGPMPESCDACGLVYGEQP